MVTVLPFLSERSLLTHWLPESRTEYNDYNLIQKNYMFELHLGDDLTVSTDHLTSPLVILGNVGQGKSVFSAQLVLELIRNQQPGVLYDPYGDLAKKIQANATSAAAKRFLQVLPQTVTITAQLLHNKFTLITGDKFTDGSADTRMQAQRILKQVYQQAAVGSWIIIDEAFELVDAELFRHYLSHTGTHTVISDTTLVTLSADQRQQLLNAAKQWVVYKPRKIDGNFLEQHFPAIKAKDIAAIQQYHYYWIDSGVGRYTKAAWPI